MKTITPFELQMLIEKCYVDVIDLRPKKEFDHAHVLIARSIPLKTFEPHSVLAHRRGQPNTPIYIFGERKADASLAAGELAAAGLRDPIVVDGGMEAWLARRLPVAPKTWRAKLLAFVRRAGAKAQQAHAFIRPTLTWQPARARV